MTFGLLVGSVMFVTGAGFRTSHVYTLHYQRRYFAAAQEGLDRREDGCDARQSAGPPARYAAPQLLARGSPRPQPVRAEALAQLLRSRCQTARCRAPNDRHWTWTRLSPRAPLLALVHVRAVLRASAVTIRSRIAAERTLLHRAREQRVLARDARRARRKAQAGAATLVVIVESYECTSFPCVFFLR